VTHDNACVYGLIKQLVLEGPGCTYIMRHDAMADGHSAWLALKAHFKGDGFRNRNVKEAYSRLESLMYEGEKKEFTFEKFIQRHMECYLELARFNEPILENKKVRHLLNYIKSPELSAAKQQVKATPNLSTNFEEAVNFLSLSVTPIKQLQRNVAAFDATRDNRTGGRGRGGRGHADARGANGRSRGRSQSRGRTSHGRGRGRYSPYTGYYTADEWQSLSSVQRTRVAEARIFAGASQQGSDQNR